MDDKLAAVVRNWSARFTANDLDHLDVERTLAAVETWDDWADAWETTAEQYAALADAAAIAGYRQTAAAHRKRAALTLQFGQFVLNDDPQRREQLHRRQCELYRLAAPDLVPAAIPYRRQVGTASVHGYVRTPPRTNGPIPVAVFLPGLESTKEQFTTYEPYLLERGIATVTVEGPGQGEGWYDHPFDLSAYLEVFGDVIAWIRRNADLDGSRIALIGTSFGGFLSLRCAAATDGLAAVVDIAGPHTLLPLEELQPVLQEGFIHLSGADDLGDASQRLQDVTLDGHLAAIDAPVLVVHGDADRIIPIEHGDRIAAELDACGADVTYDRVEGGTHSCNNLHTIVRPRIADWVADRLTTPAPR